MEINPTNCDGDSQEKRPRKIGEHKGKAGINPSRWFSNTSSGQTLMFDGFCAQRA